MLDYNKIKEKMQVIITLVEKNKYPFIVLLLGIGLLSLGNGVHKAAPVSNIQEDNETTQNGAAFDLQAFENRLEQTLAQIDGVGRVKLTLSLKATEEAVYAADIRQTQQADNNNSYESSLSIISESGYGQQPILVKNLYPTFRGALVLCDGANNDTVRLAVTQAVSTMCGIGTDKVSVLKMQS